MSYWDTDIKEPALYGYENFYETKESVKRGIALVIYIPMSIITLCMGIFLLLNEKMIGLVSVAIGGYVAWVIVSYFRQKIYNKNHMDDIVKNRQKEYDESMVRLKDINYLTALSKYDALANKLLKERLAGDFEHYAKRP